MSDNKRYYYLKLKESFFDSEEMIILESMQDGHLYSNILLKLYLRSLKNEGRLMFNDRIPYSPSILAQVTRHSVGVVEKALSLFKELGLVEILDNGAIYMSDIQNFIGESSTEADRKRKYRLQIENEKEKGVILQIGQMSGQMSVKSQDKYPPELEIELEKDLDIEKDKKKNSRFTPPTLEEVKVYCSERSNDVDPVKWFNFYEAKGWLIGKNKMKNWKAAVHTWEKSGVKSNNGGIKEPVKPTRVEEPWEVEYREKTRKLSAAGKLDIDEDINF